MSTTMTGLGNEPYILGNEPGATLGDAGEGGGTIDPSEGTLNRYGRVLLLETFPAHGAVIPVSFILTGQTPFLPASPSFELLDEAGDSVSGVFGSDLDNATNTEALSHTLACTLDTRPLTRGAWYLLTVTVDDGDGQTVVETAPLAVGV